jgi:transcriptional regulator with XRE-family HTH domain
MDKRIDERPDPEILSEIGRRLAGLRASAGLTQAEVAGRAGVDRSTVSRAELGDNPTLLTVVRLLRVYGRLGALDAFIPEPGVSPMQLVREARRRG